MLRLGLLLLAACLFTPSAHAQEEAAASTVVCVDGLAGTYVGKWEKATVRLHVICLDDQRVIGSLSDVAEDPGGHGVVSGNFSIGYGYATLSGPSLVLSTFGFTEDERHRTSSKTRAAYLKLDLEKLKVGVAEGYFVNDHAQRFNFFTAKRERSFELPPPSGKTDFYDEDLAGVWKFHGHVGETIILADVIAGVPTMHLTFTATGGRTIHLLDGATWDGSGSFSLTTPMGDGEPDQLGFFYAFGRLLGPNEMEISYVSQFSGLQGPFLAKRVGTNEFPSAPKKKKR